MNDTAAVPPGRAAHSSTTGATHGQPFVVERAVPGDREAIVELAGRALGWDATGPHSELFAWKHEENPFGASPTWVARQGGRLVGVRTFMRWRLRNSDGRTATMVRAVDTATDPATRGQGVFTRLTLTAIEELTTQGVSGVFNTPNDQSRPGYLKMGWASLGRIPITARPAGAAAALSMLRARRPATKWSQPCSAGVPAPEAFADAEALARTPRREASAQGLVHRPRSRRAHLALRIRSPALPLPTRG